MNGFWAVFKRELKGYFSTPVAYVFLVIFLFAAGYITFHNGFFEMRQADLRAFFSSEVVRDPLFNLPVLLVFMSACTAMRLWSEDRKTGAIELLFTLPITVTQAVLGKFFAAWAFLGIALLLTFPLPLTVYYLGNPDTGLIVTGYFATFLMAGSFLAIGSFFSALSKNQVISFILSVVACAVLVYAGMPTTINYLSGLLPAGMLAMIEQISLLTHFESVQRGVLEFKDLAYFVVLIIGWTWACTIILNERKAS